MSKNIFNSVQYPKVGSNTFDLSHDVKMSFKMGRLYPTLVMDCLPGDKIRVSTETMLRFAPLISPVMHRVNVTTHFFFVPNRILWNDWEKWITGEEDQRPPLFYQNVGNTYNIGSLADYMGIPVNQAGVGNIEINALPFAAYLRIYDEYYRDQNLEPVQRDPLYGGPENPEIRYAAEMPPLQRAWMHDYFTAALPWAQKGDQVMLPLGEFSDVDVINRYAPTQPFWRTNDGMGTAGTGAIIGRSTAPIGQSVFAASSPITTAAYDPNGTLVAKTSDLEAEAASINTLRRAFKLQEWLERNARGGTRYIENIMAHFGVKSSDARLNRPEFLGGSYQKMVISEVLSTAETEVPVGQMAGHGISVGAGKEFTYYCEEHGWIIGIINVQPVTAYQQGLDRKFFKADRLDYAWPSFANIGEQEVLNQEVYVGNVPSINEEVFGYVPRYAEYKYMSSRVSGEMRTSLAHWHLGRIFANRPSLNDTFIKSNPSTRIFAVEGDADHIYGHIFNSVRAVRKLPKFGTPRL